MTLLVTGATGHVGGEIVRQAMKRDMPVIAVARDAVGEAEAQAFPSVKWLQCDLADTDAVMALTARNPIDACIHAAAISNEACEARSAWRHRDECRRDREPARGSEARLMAPLCSDQHGLGIFAQQRYDATDPGGSGSRRRQRL